jgi:UDP-N-acetylmuramoyl-L-alanyl-D-glutamate--2,6-diaminopimelate ligase
MLLGELISGLDVHPAGPGGDASRALRVCDLTEDSRTVMPGSLFVARRGEHADGRQFVPQAVAAGAVAVLTDDPALPLPQAARLRGEPPFALLVARDLEAAAAAIAERFYGRPSSRLVLVGVTGTNGKTTVTFLLHQLLNALGVRAGLIGTVRVDDGREVAPASLTTPPAIELSRTLATMVESGCRAAVMEVSSHALAQRRAAALDFDVAVFTNLTGDHLDYHGTMEAYADAKALLFAGLRPDAAAVVNADDPWHTRMLRDCRARVLRCTMAGDAAGALHDPGLCAAVVRQTDPRRSRVALFGPWESLEATTRLIGRHNAMNLLQAVAALHAAAPALDPPRPDLRGLAPLLARLDPPPGRLEPASSDRDPITVFVDYAHSDDALRNVLTTLRQAMAAAPLAAAATAPAPADVARPPSLWVVFGCGGDRDRSKRPRMGAAAVELADHVVVTSDNPRTEQPAAIIEQVLADIPPQARPRVTVIEDRERAIRHAVLAAAPGDAVLIAGKGHEDYQILPDGRGGTVTRPFDDRLVARDALAARPDAPAPSAPRTAARPRNARTARATRRSST